MMLARWARMDGKVGGSSKTYGMKKIRRAME